MKKTNVYDVCPEFDTATFHLRMVKHGDGKELLSCYSDPDAVARINAENCTTDFYFKTEEEVEQYIGFWMEAYRDRAFVRLVLIPKEGSLKGQAVGTIELFGGEYGVLRIDIASEYENPQYIEEIVKLAIDRLVGLLSVETLVIMAANVPERQPVFDKLGFTKSEFRNGGYVEWKRKLHFRKEAGIAVCGLACCLCSSNDTCKGCRDGGCKDREWCKAYHCWEEQGKDSCLTCENYVCDFPIINKSKTKAIHHIINEYGVDKLMECLERNEKQGINYHYLGEYVGDYDCATEEESYELILKGWEE